MATFLVGLTGLHGSGKGFVAELFKRIGWTICDKRTLVAPLAGIQPGDGDQIQRAKMVELYERLGPFAVMEQVLRGVFAHPGPTIIDAVHNLAEWRAIEAMFPNAVLVSVVAPPAVRKSRNGHEDPVLDSNRVGYWHHPIVLNQCLMAEVGWSFNGALPQKDLEAEILKFLRYHFGSRP